MPTDDSPPPHPESHPAFPNRRDKKTALTPERHESIVALTSEGVSVSACCHRNRISRDTLYGWLEVAKLADEKLAADKDEGELTPLERLCLAFADDYWQAVADFEIAEFRLAKTANERGKGAQWALAARLPDTYSRRIKTEVSGEGGGPLKTETVVRVVILPELDAAPAASHAAGSGLAPECGAADALPR